MDCNNFFKVNLNDRRMESYHQLLRKEGYLVIKVIKDKDLEEELIKKKSLDKIRGLFSSIRILPSDIALRRESFEPEKGSHLVYGLYNPYHSKFRKLFEKVKKEKGIIADMTYIGSPDGGDFLLNTNYPETILKIAKKAGIK